MAEWRRFDNDTDIRVVELEFRKIEFDKWILERKNVHLVFQNRAKDEIIRRLQLQLDAKSNELQQQQQQQQQHHQQQQQQHQQQQQQQQQQQPVKKLF